ncbi:MAG TPA: hypothetical protein VK974_04620 [Methylophilaceae bacterium]|nr:hypothetical protein [Methylophilaceae bacterium]
MKKTYYIDYPQEHVEGQAHTYRCVSCKEITTKINGSIEGHLPSCEYRVKLERDGFENNQCSNSQDHSLADEVD